jgi:hypothetical protein
MPLSSIAEGIIEIIVEFFFEVFIQIFVRGLGFVILKCVTLGRASVGLESGGSLAMGILAWILVFFGAYKLWLS